MPGLRGMPAVTMNKVRASGVRGIVRPRHTRSEAIDGSRLAEVERDSLRAPLEHVDQDNLSGELALGTALGTGHADKAGLRPQ